MKALFIYNMFMLFSLILFFSAILLFTLHFLLGIGSLPYGNMVTSLFIGVSLIGIILSFACFCMNLGNKQLKKKKTYVFWMALSVICFLAFVAYSVLSFIERARIVGIGW